MGAAGDMLMSALYEICEQKHLFLTTMNEIFAPYQIRIVPDSLTRCGICGTHMQVKIFGTEEGDALYNEALARTAALTRHAASQQTGGAEHIHNVQPKSDPHHAQDAQSAQESGHTHTHTTYASILEQIGNLELPDEVKEHAAAIYRIIGEAEAAVHGTDLDNIHFHEVGSLDALADVVGCALLIHMIAPEQILASPIHVGNGFVKCAHGVLPVPAPATAEILKGIPYYTGSITSELCTPTGAAILRHYVSRFFSMPQLAPEAIGYGMGTKEFEIVNCVRIFLGDANPADSLVKNPSAPAAESGFTSEMLPPDDYVLSVSCNIDDMTGEAIGLATEIFMAAGALDVYTIPIQMKKNRPGILLTCICKPEDRDKFTGLFFLHTSTRGVRFQTLERAKLDSTFETRSTYYGDIRFKKSAGYGIQKEKPEFEDLKSVVLKNECSVSLADISKSIQRS
jgi:hypothetical protein